MARMRRYSRAMALPVVLVLLGQGIVGAQNAAPAPVPAIALSLAQALDMAEPRSEPVELAKVALTRNEGDAERAKSGRRPQLSATATYERSLANEFQGVFDNLDLGGGSGSGGGTDNGDTAATDFSNLPFGRANTWRATLAFSQNLYSGGRIGAQTALVSTGRRAAELGLNTARAQMLFDVTQAYYDAALSDRLVAIAEATLEQADATLRQVQAGFDAGTQPEFEVLRARVNRDNQDPLIIRQRVNREVALLRLKQLLDLPAEFELQLAESLDDERLAPPAPFAARVSAVESAHCRPATRRSRCRRAAPLPDRNAVAEAATAVRLREASLQAVQAERMPSVDAELELQPHRLSVWRRAGIRPTNWSVGRQRERADPDRRPPAGRRDGGARRRGAGAAAAAPGRRSWRHSTRGRPGRSCWPRERRGKPRRARCSRRRARTRLPMSATGRACRRSSSCRMRGCCCSRPRPIGRRPRATCRWRGPGWRCCRTCRLAPAPRRHGRVAGGQPAVAAAAQPPTQLAVSDRFKAPRPRRARPRRGHDKWRARGDAVVGMVKRSRTGVEPVRQTPRAARVLRGRRLAFGLVLVGLALGAAACGGGKDRVRRRPPGARAASDHPDRAGERRDGRTGRDRGRPDRLRRAAGGARGHGARRARRLDDRRCWSRKGRRPARAAASDASRPARSTTCASRPVRPCEVGREPAGAWRSGRWSAPSSS